MASEKRLIDANAIKYYKETQCYGHGDFREETRAYKEDIDAMPTVDAVEVARLGKLGRLMMPYSGCGRGRVGPSGCVGNFKPMELDPIEDIDGDRWVPVLEDDLSLLKAKANNAVEVVHGRKAKSVISKTGLMCTACYSDVDRDAVFCKYCGAKMDGDGNGNL